jgi:hypothetical protein
VFIPIRSYDNYIPANLHLQLLEAEGIRAYLQNENTITTNPYLSHLLGGIKLMVYHTQAERAEEILKSLEED